MLGTGEGWQGAAAQGREAPSVTPSSSFDLFFFLLSLFLRTRLKMPRGTEQHAVAVTYAILVVLLLILYILYTSLVSPLR
ncbi:hypothetical protein E2C01_100863 [Portunus trituberculatus]|uniref:Uncharacterized protein n=1 Tax=Portunus trituberculatus TaxID=210409 RepID=A0A5B7KEE9_PORTR|nr:hypothetical protein [Portunus trituberculatus]